MHQSRLSKRGVRRDPGVGLFSLAVITVLAVFTPFPAHAQGVDGGEFAARSIARAALMDLRSFDGATELDYKICADVLALAREFAPDDAGLLRRLIETHRAGADEAGVIGASRELLGLDQRDTVAALRVISHRIGQIQSVEQRMASYERLLGENGARLDPALRSRLALDAALLAQELGDDSGFARLLSQASSLDSTNKEAATLAARYFSERSDDRSGRLELLINLLKADPFDPNVHFSISAVLVEAGAFEEAYRFHGYASTLLYVAGAPSESRIADERLALEWRLQGPRVLLDGFKRELTSRREAVRRQRQQLEELGEPLDDIPTPEEVRLPYEIDQYRVAAAAALGDMAEVSAALEDLEETTAEVVRDINERVVEAGEDMSPDERRFYNDALSDTATRVAMTRLIAGLDAERASTWIRILREKTTIEPRRLAAIEGLLLLRAGQPGEAIDLLEPLAEALPEAAFGMAVAYEQLGESESAAALYDRTVEASRLSALGMYSAARYEALTGQTQGVRGDAAALTRIAEVGVPRWVGSMIEDPGAFMSLRVSAVNDTVDAFDTLRLRVTIQNTSRIPLALGPDRPLNSRLLVTPRVVIDTEPLPNASPEVFDVSQRLRLMPGERMEVDLWPDPAIVGWITELHASNRVRATWRVIQGFELGESTNFVAGPLCLTAQSNTLAKRPSVLARSTVAEMTRQIELADGEALAQTIGAFRTAIADQRRVGGAFGPDDRTALVEALARRYSGMDRAARASVIAVMPPSSVIPELARLDDAIRAEPDAELLKLVLVTRAESASDSTLQRAKSSSNQSLSAFASMLETRLAERGAGYPGRFDWLIPADG